MNDEIRRELESFHRVIVFGTENSGLINLNAKAAAGFASLAEDVAALDAAGANHSSAVGTRKSATASKTAAVKTVERLTRKIAATAVTIAGQEADFRNKYEHPRDTPSFEEELQIARSYADNAVNDKSLFVEYGLKTNFIQKLNDALAAAEQAAAEQNSGHGGSVNTTAESETILKRALNTKKMLKTIVVNIFDEDPAKLAEWTSASHVRRAAKTSGDGSGETPPTA